MKIESDPNYWATTPDDVTRMPAAAPIVLAPPMETPMRRTILLVSALILVLCVVQSSPAQLPTVPRGTRVRVTFEDNSSKPMVGVMDSVGDGMVRFRTGREATSTIAVSHIARLEVSSARKRPMWSMTAPLWMPLAAGGAGAALGYATSSDDDFLDREFGAMAGGVLAGGLGLLVGTSLALVVKEDRWETVHDATRASRALVAPSLYVAPGSSGVKLGMRAAF